MKEGNHIGLPLNMKSDSDNIVQNVEATNSWRRCALATAAVSGAFSLIVCVFLLLNYGRSIIVKTQQETNLLNLKAQSQAQPENKQILTRVRELDLQMRQQRVRALDRSVKGTYLLLAGVTVLLISLKLAGRFAGIAAATSWRGRPGLASRQHLAGGRKRGQDALATKDALDTADQQIRTAAFARWAVAAGVLLLGAASLFLALQPKIDFSRAGAPGAASASAELASKSWPSFRGPNGSGISTDANVPSSWDGKTGKGILWKTKVPLPGNNSPVVWGDRIFLSGGDPNALQVYGFDAKSGALLWTGNVTRTAPKKGQEPLEPMEDTGYAAPTVATDGRHVYAIFITGDVGCFDFNGRKVWEKSLGIPDSAYGYASSLAVYRNLVLIQFDQGGVDDGKSAMIALDGSSGRIAWRTKRPVGNSWCSPIVVSVGDQAQLITCADPWVISYDPAKGAELWRAKCIKGDIAPSPTYSNGLVFAVEPYSKLVAIRADGHGDVTKTHVAWTMEDGGPDICSPLSNGQYVFLLATEGLLSCYKVSDGKKVWEHDFQENFKASPSLVGDKLYVLSVKGVMYLVQVGPTYKELGKCPLGEECSASPAFADGRIFIRGMKNLYGIGSSK
jgi:outer membrane protein assembly factor BamB